MQLFSSMKSRSSVQLAGKTACTWVVFSNQYLHRRQKRLITDNLRKGDRWRD